jgi:hypothetical protein
LQALKKFNSLIRVASQTAHNRLKVYYLYESLLLFIEHLENATEVLDLLFRVLGEYIPLVVLLLYTLIKLLPTLTAILSHLLIPV